MRAASPARPTPIRLHVPDEPGVGRERWYRSVLDGAQLDGVLAGEGGVVDWLWDRWQVLERSGITRSAFGAVVLAYRRELWLWLAGERNWDQCCSELIGRVARRVPS
ncbi:MAG: hypothetical protein ACYDHU_10980 [Acidimicrobiales bacterium]